MHQIVENLVMSRSQGDLDSLTLVTGLAHMLTQAEARFGERDRRWTLLGVEFYTTPHPWIWFPDYPKRRDIVIRISEDCMTNRTKAYFQLSQEVFHLLTPIPNVPATNLEEGIATEFSLSYLHSYFEGEPWDSWIGGSYIAALRGVQELLAFEPDAVRLLRQLEKGGKRVSTVTAEEIRAVAPKFPYSTAQFLADKFS